MKNLQDFRLLVEEDKTDYSKFDMLVRAGLANKAQLARIHRILDKMTEERPQFNNADREIMRNLFNRMVDLVANNKQIFQKSRQAVREETDVESIEAETLDESNALTGDPPFVLVLKRKAIRYYPNESKVALYYNQKLDKYFSVPYGAGVEGPVQAEETQVEIVEAVIDQLHDIVKNKQATKVKFGNGKSVMVDGYTASAITQVHKSLNDMNKKKIADMVHKSPEHLKRVAEFAFSKVK